jgi:hypothetical protein
MNEDELEKRRKISNELIKIFKPLVKETVYENYIEVIMEADYELKNNSYAVLEFEKMLKEENKKPEKILPIIKELIYNSIKLNSLEDFFKLTKFSDKYEIIKDIKIRPRDKLIDSSLKYSERLSPDNIAEKIENCFNSYIKRAVSLDKEIKEYYERYLFLKNLDLYIKKGKHGDQLRQLCTSDIKTRGKFNDNKSPLTYFKENLLNENEKEFLHSMTEKIESFKIESHKQSLYSLDNSDFNFENLAKNEDRVIYQFTISSETPKKYFLDRDKLIYAKYNPIEDRYFHNFTDFFIQFTINKTEDINLKIGDKVLVFSHYNNFVKANTFLDKYSNYIEDNKKINLCKKQDIEKIRDYFLQVLSKKISNNFETLNEERELKIKELEEQYYAITMPTHEDLLEFCKYHNNIKYIEEFLKIKEREVIGSKLRELRELQNNAAKMLKVANKFTLLNTSLNKKQKEGAEAIFNKYYNEESKRIDFDFDSTFNLDLNKSTEEIHKEEKENNQKIAILKTTCVKSDFDFS